MRPVMGISVDFLLLVLSFMSSLLLVITEWQALLCWKWLPRWPLLVAHVFSRLEVPGSSWPSSQTEVVRAP